ncbi:MAG TPA: hypothetical protein VGF45_23540 [Polyangia bacterium]
MDLLGRVKAAWPAGGRWEWDASFGCVLTTVNQATAPAGRAALTGAMSGTWTRKTLDQAPVPIQQLCGRTGGLRGEQMVAATALGNAVAYALWWPWGDGTTVSVRIGCASADAGENLVPSLRAAFGV